jgi:hypothetical protein
MGSSSGIDGEIYDGDVAVEEVEVEVEVLVVGDGESMSRKDLNRDGGGRELRNAARSSSEAGGEAEAEVEVGCGVALLYAWPCISPAVEAEEVVGAAARAAAKAGFVPLSLRPVLAPRSFPLFFPFLPISRPHPRPTSPAPTWAGLLA